MYLLQLVECTINWSPVATGWAVLGSNPGGGEIFRTCPDRPWGPPSPLYNAYRVSFSGIKRPGSGVERPPPSRAEVKEWVKLFLSSPSGPSWRFLKWPSGYLAIFLFQLPKYARQSVKFCVLRAFPYSDKIELYLYSVQHNNILYLYSVQHNNILYLYSV
jgi:hypothetical protein